jgi:ABC-type oligopeptide transport system substrate-binding subunit
MFKKIVSLVLSVLMLAGAAVGLVSCGDLVGEGAQISVYLGGPIYDFDPQGEYTDDAAISVISLLFEPLFRIDDDGDLKLAMASGYDIDSDERTITIDIRESYWSDGHTQVKASDFVYAWQKLIRCDNSNPLATLLFDIENAVKVKQGDASLDEFGVRALDNTTLEITLEEGCTSYTAFLRNLANVGLSPLNSLAVYGKEEYWTKKVSTISSNGPFRLSGYDIAQGEFELERNKGYRRSPDSGKAIDAYVTPHLLKTVWNIELSETNPDYISDTDYLNALLDSLANKTVFYVGEITPEKRVEYKDDAEITDMLSTYSYVFNNGNELFQDAAVRRIMSQVIDREHIISLVTFGKAATGLVPNTVMNGSKVSSKNGFRKAGGDLISKNAELTIDAAKQQLAALSYTPGAFTLTYADNAADELIAKYVAQQWTALGFTVELEPVSSVVRYVAENGSDAKTLNITDAELQYLYETGNFDVIAIDYQMLSTDPLAVFSTLTSNMNGSGINVGSGDGITLDPDGNRIEDYAPLPNLLGYASSAFDAKVKAAYEEKDLEDRAELLHEAEEILMEDMPLIPLIFNQSYYIVNSSLSKVSVDWFGHPSFTDAKQKDYEKYLPVETTVTTVPSGEGEE